MAYVALISNVNLLLLKHVFQKGQPIPDLQYGFVQAGQKIWRPNCAVARRWGPSGSPWGIGDVPNPSGQAGGANRGLVGGEGRVTRVWRGFQSSWGWCWRYGGRLGLRIIVDRVVIPFRCWFGSFGAKSWMVSGQEHPHASQHGCRSPPDWAGIGSHSCAKSKILIEQVEPSTGTIALGPVFRGLLATWVGNRSLHLVVRFLTIPLGQRGWAHYAPRSPWPPLTRGDAVVSSWGPHGREGAQGGVERVQIGAEIQKILLSSAVPAITHPKGAKSVCIQRQNHQHHHVHHPLYSLGIDLGQLLIGTQSHSRIQFQDQISRTGHQIWIHED